MDAFNCRYPGDSSPLSSAWVCLKCGRVHADHDVLVNGEPGFLESFRANRDEAERCCTPSELGVPDPEPAPSPESVAAALRRHAANLDEAARFTRAEPDLTRDALRLAAAGLRRLADHPPGPSGEDSIARHLR